MKTNFKKNDGFTLVELIVVIAILAILAAVAIPAYSGYIEKANTAGDEQLLNAVNKAFASACSINGDDIYLVKNVKSFALDDNNKIPENAVDPYGEEFWQFYGDNKDAEFKNISGLYFDTDKYAFVPGISSNGITVSKEQVEKILAGSLGSLTATEIVDMIGTTNNYILAKPLYFENIIADPQFAELATKALGQDYQIVLNAEAEKLAKNDYGTGWDELSDAEKTFYISMQEEQAQKNVGSKVTVLVAAQGAAEYKNTVLTNLQTSPAQYVEDLKASMNKSAENGGDPINGLSQAAVAYGLYASYVTSQNGTLDPTAAWENMKTDTQFHEYLAGNLAGTNVQADLEGFMASMDTFANLDADTANKIAQDGVNNAGLQQALKDILGKTE